MPLAYRQGHFCYYLVKYWLGKILPYPPIGRCKQLTQPDYAAAP